MPDYMEVAYELAEKAAQKGEVPVGAVVVYQGKIIGQGANAPLTQKDSTVHAEMMALRQACHTLNHHRLDGGTLYVTLEPCAMCAGAISLSRIEKVYFGAYDPKGGAIEHGAQVFKYSLHKPEVYGGFHEERCGLLLRRFFEDQRDR